VDELTLTVEGTRTELTYLKDILSMWITGCEAELRGVDTNVPDEDVHWAATGMREMLTSALEMQIRLEVTLSG
jgi:hypothetical protein